MSFPGILKSRGLRALQGKEVPLPKRVAWGKIHLLQKQTDEKMYRPILNLGRKITTATTSPEQAQVEIYTTLKLGKCLANTLKSSRTEQEQINQGVMKKISNLVLESAEATL